MRPLDDPRAIRIEAARKLGLELAVDRAFYAEVDEHGQASFAFGYCSGNVRAIAGRYALDELVAAGAALRAGRTVVVPDVERREELSDAERQRCRELQIGAFLQVPLVKDGRVAAFFALHQARPREWTQADLALAIDAAERTWGELERAKHQNALRTVDERYRGLCDALDEGFFIAEVEYDGRGEVVDLHFREVNPAFGRQSGMRGVLGQRLSAFAPTFERHWRDAIGRAMRSGEPVRVENRQSDTGRWYSVRYSRVGGEGSRLLAAAFDDVTERKHAELITSRLAAIVEASDDAIISKDLDGVVQTWNAGAERMFGYAAEEAIGQPVTILMPPERVNEESGILARIRRGERVDHYETVRRRKNGSLLDVSLCVSPIVDRDGKVVAASQVARDITHRKRAEATQRERDERQAFLLKLADALRGETDADAMANVALNLIGKELDLDRAWIGRVYAGEELAVMGPEYRRDGLKPVTGSFRIADFPESDRQIREGTLAVSDAADDPSLSERDRQSLAAIDVAAFVGASVRGREAGLIWAFVAASAKPRVWTPGETALVEDVAERTWAAIERAGADAALRASELRYRTLFDSIDEAFCTIEVLFDEDGKPFDYRFLSTNAAFEQQTGLRDVIGRRMKAMVPDHEARWFEIYGRIVRAGEPERFEQRAEALGRWYEVFAFPLGPPNQLGVLFKDILTRKQAEAALRSSEQQRGFLLTLLDALREQPDAQSIGATCVHMLAEHFALDRCCIVSLSREQDWLQPGPEYRREDLPPLFGGASEGPLSEFPACLRCLEAQSLAVNDVAIEPDLPEAEKAVFGALQGMTAFIAAPLRVGEKNFVWMLLAGSRTPREWTREEVRLVEDIAERTWSAVDRAGKDAELRDRGFELARANRAKDEFIAMLSHELRNPLAPITTTLQLMKLRAPDLLARERGVIEDQVRHLTGLVDDLLDVARITSGKVELKAERLEVKQIVAAAVETTQTVMESHRQTLHVDVDGGLIVSGDRLRLVQVLVNLLTNAAKYSPPGRTVWLSAAADDGQVVLRVRDEGQGIVAELLPRIFEPFTQDAQSMERSRGGLGLGLAIVRNLVTLHGGSVVALSDGAYKGSEFIVRLPLLERRRASEAPAAERQSANTASAVKDAERIKVLIVDDYAPAADSLSLLLQEMGYRTQVAHDGASALQAIREFEPQVALVDIGLPVIDGYEVAQTVRRTPGREKLPLVAVTGYGQASDHAHVMEAGFDAHVVKPLDAAHISELIEKLMAA